MKDYLSLDENINLLRRLIQIESPYFHEDNVMEFANGWLHDNGLDSRIHEYYEPKETGFHGKNVCGVLDSRRPGPTIYVGGHLDTVELCQGWTKPPFEGVIEDGYMYGVGSLDMKAGCASAMLALAEFNKSCRDTFKGKIIYQFVSDEEGPFGLGTVSAIQDNVDGIRDGVDFAIITEPSAGFTGVSHPCICLGAKGGYRYTIKLKGLSAHAATPHLGISAAVDGAKIVSAIENMEKKVDPKLGESTPCVIGFSSSLTACSVPDEATIDVFHHNVRGETPQVIEEALIKAIEEAGIRSSYEISFRGSPSEGFDGGFMPYCTDENNPYITTLSEAVRKVCGTGPNLSYFQSIGDFNHIGGLLGIPTVLLGPDGDKFHSSDERVNINSVCEITKIIFEFLYNTTR